MNTHDVETRERTHLLPIIEDILDGGADFTACPRGPYAGCMSAGCTTNKAGDVTFACPVFSGTFQLAETDVVCHIGNKGSSSLTPRLLSPAP